LAVKSAWPLVTSPVSAAIAVGRSVVDEPPAPAVALPPAPAESLPPAPADSLAPAAPAEPLSVIVSELQAVRAEQRAKAKARVIFVDMSCS
jgi:hypothetical protein